MAAPALRPLGIGEILDVSLKLTVRNLGTLVRVVLFVVAPAQVLIAVIDVSAVPNYRPGFSVIGVSSGTQLTPGQASTALAGELVSTVVAFLAGELATGAAFRAIAGSYLGLGAGWRGSLAFAARRIHSIIWIAFLGGLLTVIGFVFVIVPGIYLLVSFAVALPVLMSEGQRGSKALGRSRALIAGRWWRTAGILLVGFLLVGIVSALITGALSALIFAGANGTVALAIIGATIGTLAAVVTTPFTAAYHTVLYFDLRVRKEAFDLRLLAAGIGVEPPPGWHVPAPPPPGASGQPPFWPPPPGWTPGPASAPAGNPSEPPFRPPPPGWQSGAGTPAREDEPPFWPPPPGWKPGPQ